MESPEAEKPERDPEGGRAEAPAAEAPPLLELEPGPEACGPRKGAPARPLLEALLLFLAFWLPAYFPVDSAEAGSALSYPGYYLALLAGLLPKAAFLLYFMSRSADFPAFGLRSALPRAREALSACLCAALAFGLALLPSLLPGLLGFFGLRGGVPVNPFLEAAARPESPAWLMIPLVALSSLAIGYGEELFFRVYLILRLELAGLPEAWALLASALVFGSAHGRQGLLGLGMGSLLGLLFAWRWKKGRSYHEIALGHSLYDFAVILLTLYA